MQICDFKLFTLKLVIYQKISEFSMYKDLRETILQILSCLTVNPLKPTTTTTTNP